MKTLNEDSIKTIIANLNQRGAPLICPLCNKTNSWALAEGFLVLSVRGSFKSPHLVLDLPCVGLSCQNCGNTHLINLGVLGLAHLAGERF
jgi:hypothetical protein